MTLEIFQESLRWAELRGFRWMPGMLDNYGRRVVGVRSSLVVVDPHTEQCEEVPQSGLFPDVADPATRGCLEELAREITGQPLLHIRRMFHDKCWVASWPTEEPDALPRTYDREQTWPLLIACEDYERGVTP